MLVAFTGFLAGFTHVLSGPDHLAAVTPLAVESRRESWRPGLRWGFGHSAGVAVVGLLAFVLREALPIERISVWSERLVGVVLVGVGLWAVRRALRIRIHTDWHEHDGEKHRHVHLHGPGNPRGKRGHTHAAFGIGTLHGLAGSSHFFGVLPALALPDVWHAAFYLLAFGAGTVAAMSGFSAVFGRLAGWFALSHLEAYRGLMYASAAGALGVGGWWLWQAG
jgi:sulfite exporter TauE/SafE